MIISFDLPGKPSGKGRARATSTGRMYTPQATRDAEGFVRHQAAQAMTGKEILRGAVRAWVEVEVEPPVSFSKKKRKAALDGEVFPTVKPDTDNTQKLIFDACNGIVYVDDKQIVTVNYTKRYAPTSGTTVSFQAME